jgi:predicted acyltransferase
MGLEEWLSRHVFGAVLEPRAASLLYALCFVAFWYAILSRMYRRGTVVRV